MCLALPRPAQADAVLDWNGRLMDAIRSNGINPPMASRQFALLNLAMFDSANAAVGLRYEPYSFDGMPIANARPDVAADAAGAAILAALYPDRPARRVDSTDSTAIGLGTACAEAILKARAQDGTQIAAPPYLGSTKPGFWRPDGKSRQPGLLPTWGATRPWVLATPADAGLPPPPPIGSVPWLDGYNAVKSLGSANGGSHNPDHSQIAQFWADGEGTETPPGHWIAIARELTGRVAGEDVVDTSRRFALLSLALADTAIAVWEGKYRFATWRPISAIRDAGQLGMSRVRPEPGWEPFLDTPPFPEYPSGHSAFSAAAARVLAVSFGHDDIAFDTGTRSRALGPVTRHFNSLSDAAEEAGLSRIYGGIHFYFSHKASVELGRKVADIVISTRLRRLAK